MLTKEGHFVLEIELGNVGMRTAKDIAWALKDASSKIHLFGVTQAGISDENGNTVGAFATDVNALEDSSHE